VVRNDARCKREIKSRLAMTKQISTRRKVFPPGKWGLNIREK